LQYDGKIAVYALLCETVSSAHAALGQLCRSFRSSVLACETLPDHDAIVTLRGLLSMSASKAASNATESNSPSTVNPAVIRHTSSRGVTSRKSSLASATSTQRSRSGSNTMNVDSTNGPSQQLLFYKDFDDVPLDDVVASVEILSSARVFNKSSGLLDALEPDLDPGTPFETLTFATSRVDDNHATAFGSVDSQIGNTSSHESAAKRLLLHDAAACTLAKSALGRLCIHGGGVHRRLEDPGLKDFRLYLSAGYEKQERLFGTTYSSVTGSRDVASEGNIFAVTSLFDKTLQGNALGQSSRTLQHSACEVALLHHLSLARRAYSLVSRGRFLQAMTACTHAMRSKSTDAIMSNLLADALRRRTQAAAEAFGGAAGGSRSNETDFWSAQLQQAALEIHTFFIHIMAVACANMGSFLHAIKLYASWIAAIHVDSQWWFSASLASFQHITPAHIISKLPMSQRQQLISSAKAVTAIHLMSGQFSNEVMSACMSSCSKQREHMWQNSRAGSMDSLPPLELEMSSSDSQSIACCLFFTHFAGLQMTALMSSMFYASADHASMLKSEDYNSLLQVLAFLKC
jgi:hypothetical protein